MNIELRTTGMNTELKTIHILTCHRDRYVQVDACHMLPNGNTRLIWVKLYLAYVNEPL